MEKAKNITPILYFFETGSSLFLWLESFTVVRCEVEVVAVQPHT